MIAHVYMENGISVIAVACQECVVLHQGLLGRDVLPFHLSDGIGLFSILKTEVKRFQLSFIKMNTSIPVSFSVSSVPSTFFSCPLI